MLKGYYLVYDTLNLETPDGVEKKIISQLKMFKDNGINMQFYTLSKKNGTFWHNPELLGDADFIYFRRGTIAGFSFVNFLRKVKKLNKHIVIFMEIPTFPYEKEYDNSFKSKIALTIDHIFRKQLKKYISRFVIVNHHNGDVWGVKVINLVNGVNVHEIKPKIPRIYDGTIRICCVAKFSPWHGYERIIRGLSDYYKSNPSEKIQLVMVGTGVETEKYKELTEELGLNAYIDFRGQLIGEKLDDIYDECDIGCCSLGRYKSNISMTSELKSREFMAKGMPMICGCRIDILENIDYPYVIFFSNDNTIINLDNVVSFYKSMILKESSDEIIQNIRNFAMKKFDISITYKPIVDEALRLCGQ